MSLFDLSGKYAVVTGGTVGIGLMFARGLLDAGATVAISSRKQEACAQAVESLRDHGPVTAIPADLAEPDECARLAKEVGEQTEAVHILVNNAGATWGAPLEQYPTKAWDKVMNLNVRTPFLLVQAFLPALRRAGTPDDPARVINLGSADGIHVPEMPTFAYSTSKAAIHQLTRHLARTLGPEHIAVNTVAPGPFPSRMMAAVLEEHGEEISAAAPLRRLGRPDDMAGVAVFLSSRAGSYVNGALIPVDGGIATTASGG